MTAAPLGETRASHRRSRARRSSGSVIFSIGTSLAFMVDSAVAASADNFGRTSADSEDR
jgi:hypothetical protein